MYTYTVPFAVRSDSANHSEIDKQADTSLPTYVQAQIRRGTHATRYISTFSPRHTHTFFSPLRLDTHTGRCFVNATLHGF